MMKRILVALDDSPPALAGASLAIELARTLRAEVLFVTVSETDGDAVTVVRHVDELAHAAGVAATSSVTDGGHAFEVLLDAAQRWGADLIIMGRSDKRRPGMAYVGSQTEHLLEFTHIPVLVVPDPDTPGAADDSPSGSVA